MEDLKNKVEKLKLEVEKAKKDYQDTFSAFYDSQYTEGANRYIRIKSDLLIFLKDKIDKTKIKQLKETVINNSKNNYKKKYYTPHHLSIVKYALEIIEQYKNEYEKQELTTELCKLTNCLEKLTPTKTCNQCKSEYPKEAKFCPACGCELYKPIIDSSKLQLPTTGISSDSKYFYATWDPTYYQDKPTDPKEEKVQETKNLIYRICPRSKICKTYDETKSICNNMEFNYTSCNNYCKKEEKVLCDSCTYYAECDHPNLTECDQYENYIKEVNERHACADCDRFNNNICEGFNIPAYSDTIRVCLKFKFREKETKKESTHCSYFDKCSYIHKNNKITYCYTGHMPQVEQCKNYIQFEKEKSKCLHSTQCGKYSSDSTICKKDYNICVFYRNWDLFIKCPYHSTCKDIAPTECYTEYYTKCEYYKLKEKIVNCSHYQECNYISKEYDKKCSDNTSILQCIKYKNYNKKRNKCPYYNLSQCVYSHNDCTYTLNFDKCKIYQNYYYNKKEKDTSNKCPHFDKCSSSVKSVQTAACHNKEKYMYAIEPCEDYKRFEKETKCPYYTQCTYSNKGEWNVQYCFNSNNKNQFREEHCKEYKDFEKEKNRCPYYNQCKYYNINSNVCSLIEDKEANMGCDKYHEFKEKEAKTKHCVDCSNIKIECNSCINLEKWTPKFVKCLYSNNCNSFNIKDNYCTGQTTTHRIGCYIPKETKESLCHSCYYRNPYTTLCEKLKIKPIYIKSCSAYYNIFKSLENRGVKP